MRLLQHCVAATQLSLDQAQQLGKLDVPRDFLNIGKPDVFNLSAVLLALLGDQRHAQGLTLAIELEDRRLGADPRGDLGGVEADELEDEDGDDFDGFAGEAGGLEDEAPEQETPAKSTKAKGKPRL